MRVRVTRKRAPHLLLNRGGAETRDALLKKLHCQARFSLRQTLADADNEVTVVLRDGEALSWLGNKGYDDQKSE